MFLAASKRKYTLKAINRVKNKIVNYPTDTRNMGTRQRNKEKNLNKPEEYKAKAKYV